MEYIVGRKVPLPKVTVTPFAVSASECNVIAAITLQGVHLFELLAAVNRKDAFQFDHRIIPTPTETNSVQNAGSNRAMLNRDIVFEEIHDVFLDRTISPARTTDEPITSAFRQIAWSPPGLIPYQKCILAAVTADHRVILYRNGRWKWEEIEQLSSRWLQHVREHFWESDSTSVEDFSHSSIFSLHKKRSYLLGTIAVAWSPLFSDTSNWAWLVTLQRSGHVVIWKAQASFTSLSLVACHDLKLNAPSVLKLHRGHSCDQLLMFVGSHSGSVKCWSLSSNEENTQSCNFLGAVLQDEDSITLSAIEVINSNDFLVIALAKNNAVVVVTTKCDGNGLECINVRYALLPGLQLSGLAKLAEGNIVCVTEDYLVIEIDLTGNVGDSFPELKLNQIKVPNNPSMLCRGITTCWSGDRSSFFMLESLKVAYDHLKCRQPTSLTVYVQADLQKVTGILESAENMQTSLVALETYKALNGSNWETIWEIDLENMHSEDDYYLQLLRWLALYKCNACFVERRYDKEIQEDLKSRAYKAEFSLQLRHIQRTFSGLLNFKNGELTVDQRLNLSLAHKFITSAAVKESNSPIDNVLVKNIKTMFQIDVNPPEEECAICKKPIPFEKREEGTCPKGHSTLRCKATLRTCYGNTFSCRWCGAHYHPDSGIVCCILCGGPCV